MSHNPSTKIIAFKRIPYLLSAAYFWAGSTRTVGNQGFRIRDENGRPDVLRKYKKEGVTITLPEGKTLRDIKWFSVWCEEFEVCMSDFTVLLNFKLDTE